MILGFLNTVLEYSLRMCMDKDIPGQKNIMGDNLREIIICVGRDILYDLIHSSSCHSLFNTFLVLTLNPLYVCIFI